MAIYRKKTYQYILTEDECQLFNFLRRCEDDSIELLALKDHPRLSQIFSLSLNVEGRNERRYTVDAHQLIQETARKAAEYLRELLIEQPTVYGSESSRTTSIHDPCNHDKFDLNDRDLIQKTQKTIEGNFTQHKDAEVIPWEAFRERFIPKSVKVAFNFDDLSVDLEDELRKQFTGVKFDRNSTQSPEAEDSAVDSNKKPRGVRNMVIELADDEVAEDPSVENKVREQYPWAIFQSKADPNILKKRRPESAAQDLSKGQILDPIQHLCDLAEYASEALSTQESNPQSMHIHENWDTLDSCRKIDIAHARAIESQYGNFVDGVGCSHCVNGGYECKVYASELRNISTMELGSSCQNCRLRGNLCDLTPVVQKHAAHPLINTDSNTLGTKETPTVGHSEATPTSSIAATCELRLTVIDDSKKNRFGSVGTDVLTSASTTSSMAQFARSIGVDLTPPEAKLIHEMYMYLRSHRAVLEYTTRALSSEKYYSNLLVLYALVYGKEELDLALVVLLKFQYTNYNRLSALPGAEIAVRAFQFLPQNSGLCRWLTTLYAFLWGTQNHGDYDKFTKAHPGLNTLALCKLLYAVAYERDPFTEGLDAAVLMRWCHAHDHVEGSQEQLMCKASQKGLRLDLEEAKRRETTRLIDNAYMTVKQYGNTTILRKWISEMIQTSSNLDGKRKNGKTPAQSSKKTKKVQVTG